MPQRETKQVFVLTNERRHDFADFADFMRSKRQELRGRLPFEDIGESFQSEPELMVGITLDDLLARIVTLESKLRRMERTQKAILSRATGVQQKFVVIKELTREQASKIVQDYIHNKGRADTEELMDLGIELKLLVGILDELKNEGKIKPAEEVASRP